MEPGSIKSLNRINISNVDISNDPIDVLWMISSDISNMEIQNKLMHCHTFFEIHYIMEGSIKYRVESKEYSVNKKQFFIIPPGVKHMQSFNTNDFKKLTLAFEVNDTGNKNLILLFKEKKFLYDMTNDIEESLIYVCKQAIKKGPYYVELIKKRLNELVYLFINDSKILYEQHSDDVDDRVLLAIRFIKDNPNIFFNCMDIAHECGLSAKQLGRLFQKYENKSLLEYIHKQKIRDIKEALKYSDKSQKKISSDLGFSSVNYFNSFFVSNTGMTPAEYREKNKVSVAEKE